MKLKRNFKLIQTYSDDKSVESGLDGMQLFAFRTPRKLILYSRDNDIEKSFTTEIDINIGFFKKLYQFFFGECIQFEPVNIIKGGDKYQKIDYDI